MGLFKPSVLGSPTQSAGKVTFVKRKGQYIFKEKIETNESNSPAQQWVKNRFSFVQAFSSAWLTDFIVRFWKRWENDIITYVNAFSGFNLKRQGSVPEPLIPFVGNPALIVSTRGTLEGVSALDVIYDTGNGDTHIQWSPIIIGGGLPTDHIIIAIVVFSTLQFYISDTKIRSDVNANISIPAGLTAGTDIVVYLSTYRGLTGKEVTSTSQYSISTAI